MQNFQSDSQLLTSNLYFDRILFSYESTVPWHWRTIQNLKKNWLVISKLAWRIWQIFTRALKSLKNLHFSGRILPKVYNVWAIKKYRGVAFHNNEEWYKIWKKTDLWFGKWHKEFAKFSPEHSKVSKLGVWWDTFIQSRKYMSLKFLEELCVMTMKNDAKLGEELKCRFKIEMRNLINFDLSTQKSQKFAL